LGGEMGVCVFFFWVEMKWIHEEEKKKTQAQSRKPTNA
jgi:hypothetical protein